MNKTVIAVIVGLLAIGGITGVALSNRSDQPPGAESSTESALSHDLPENGTATETTSEQNAAVSDSAQVDIKNFAYTNNTISVKKGTTVRWTNQDTIKHDVAPDNPGSAFQGSELLARGESYEWTFNETGTYTYHCSPHPNMTGTVVVTD